MALIELNIKLAIVFPVSTSSPSSPFNPVSPLSPLSPLGPFNTSSQLYMY